MEHPSDIPPCLIFIDREGRWYHRGIPMVHREFIRLFYQQMERDAQGRYVIEWQGERCYVDVEDTPFVVRSTLLETCEDSGLFRFVLILSDDSRDELAPETLYVGPEDVLYCTVKGRTFPARFSRAAYYQLAEHVEEDEGGAFFLPLNGRRHPIGRQGT